MFLDSILNTVNNVAGTVAGKASEIAPLAGSMSAALTNLGIQPPKELSQLAAAFHSNVVQPNTPVTGQSPVNDIINYFGSMMKAQKSGQPLSSTQKIVAAGANQVSMGGITFNPIYIIGAAVVIVVIVLVAKK